jgi:hypothetical protein
MAMIAKSNVLLLILAAVAELCICNVALAEVRARDASDKIPYYVHAIKTSSNPAKREELSEELETRLRRKDVVNSLSDGDIKEIESLLDDDDPWISTSVEDMLADIGVRAKDAVPHLTRLLHAAMARDRQLAFGPDFPEEGSICYALSKIEGTFPSDCLNWGRGQR